MIKANITREDIINLALLQHHKLYVHGKDGPETFDCAGLVKYVYEQLYGINLYNDGYGKSTTTMMMTNPYGILSLFEENDPNKDLSCLNMGDILFFHRQDKDCNEPKEDNKYPGHCGIYLYNHKFIHSPRTKGKVVINSFDKSNYWLNLLVASKDIVSDTNILQRKRKN